MICGQALEVVHTNKYTLESGESVEKAPWIICELILIYDSRLQLAGEQA